MAKDAQLNFRLPAELAESFRERVKTEGRKQALVIRKLVELYADGVLDPFAVRKSSVSIPIPRRKR